MEQTKKILFSGINTFVQEIETEAFRSLYLLKAIEVTISKLNRFTAQLRSDAQFAEKFITVVDDTAEEIDPDNHVASMIENTQSVVFNLYNELVLLRKSLKKDTRLCEEDGVEEAFAECITAAADLQNNLNDLHWRILEHDSDLSKVSKSFTSAKSLIKSLID